MIASGASLVAGGGIVQRQPCRTGETEGEEGTGLIMLASISPDLMNLLSLSVGLVGGVLASAVGVRMSEKAKAREKQEENQRLVRHFFEEVGENASNAIGVVSVASEEVLQLKHGDHITRLILTLDVRRSTLFYDNLPAEFMTHEWLRLISRYCMLVVGLNQSITSRENYRIRNRGSDAIIVIENMDNAIRERAMEVYDHSYKVVEAIPDKHRKSMPETIALMTAVLDGAEARRKELPPTES
jgi:hypothetical protein